MRTTATDRRAARPRPRRRPAPTASGFTLVELLISLFILVLILVGVLLLFDLNSRLARAQLHIAEMQQSQRIGQYSMVRMARMAGRGGLPVFQPAAPPDYDGKLLPAGGVSLAVQNNVAAGVRIGASDDAKVVQGTDVLTLRGVFNGLVYQVNPASGVFTYDPGSGDGSLILSKTSPTGVPQSLADMAEAIDQADDATEALLLISPLGDHAVVEIVGGAVQPSGAAEPDSVQINFKVTGGGHTDDYAKLSPAGVYPPAMATVSWAGILEEYKYYIREVRADPADPASELVPRLSRARLYPNTDDAYRGDDANLHEDLADNVIDLQLALGVDTDVTERIEEGDGTVVPLNADDWLFNGVDDDDPTGDVAATALWNDSTHPLYYLRVTTVARTDRRDAGYQAEPLGTIEDKDYTVAPYNVENQREQRMYHRRILRTVVDLRNLG